MEWESESASTVKFVVDKVSFVNKLAILNKATSDDARPTQGYLYQEICNISFESVSFCADLLEYLVSTLESKSYHVKLKVLRIMRFVVDNGHKDFKQALRRKAQGIREATKFGGPPDPLHGNAPYIMLRKEAKELCAVLFDIQEDARDEGLLTSARKVSSTLGGMGSGSKNTMQGFGNVSNREKSLTASIVGGILDLAGKVVEPAPSAPREPVHDSLFSSYKPVQFGPGQDSPCPEAAPDDTAPESSSVQRRASVKSKCMRVHRPGRAGGGWEDSDDETPAEESLRESSPASTDSSPLITDNHQGQREDPPTQTTAERDGSGCLDDWTAEMKLVKEVTEKKDTLLKRKDIESFMKSCSTMNCSKVVESVGNSLGSASCAEQLHSLQLIEAFLRTDLVSPDEMATLCQSGLRMCYNSAYQQTHIKAKKVILILEKLCSEGSEISNIIMGSGQGSSNVTSSDCVPSGMVGCEVMNDDLTTNISGNRIKNISHFPFIKAPFAGRTTSENDLDYGQTLLVKTESSH